MFFFVYFTFAGVKKIICHTEDFYIEAHYIKGPQNLV